MITLESITKKLGYNPLTHTYCTNDYEDDNWENPFADLSIEEIDFIYRAAKDNPESWTNME